jgi:uncharacterized SAM-binding protein YcdF (DUF218 family)
LDFKKEYVLLLAIALLFSLLLFGCVAQPAFPSATPTPTPTPAFPSPSVSPSPEAKIVSVTFVVNNGTANASKTLDVALGTTVLAALEANFAVAKKQYSCGALVTSIDGVAQNESAGLFWQYYVDGALAPVGAGDFKLEENGTSVEWRFEKPPEFK